MSGTTARATAERSATVIVGAVACLFIILVISPESLVPSAAAEPFVCLETNGDNGDDDYGQFVVKDSSTGSHGTKSDVRFSPAEAKCQRINSLGVLSPTGNGYFEFGWVLGWSTISSKFYSTPTMFTSARTSGGDPVNNRVFESSQPSVGVTHNVRGSDVNQNTYWGGYLDGVAFEPASNLDFASGRSYVNAERGYPTDGFFSEFKAIQEYEVNWNYTDLLSKTGRDPGYKVVIDANQHHVQIVPE